MSTMPFHKFSDFANEFVEMSEKASIAMACIVMCSCFANADEDTKVLCTTESGQINVGTDLDMESKLVHGNEILVNGRYEQVIISESIERLEPLEYSKMLEEHNRQRLITCVSNVH